MSEIKKILCQYGVEFRKLREIVVFEHPDPYLVKSINYDATSTASMPIQATPVLAARKTFILGYTSETNGIYPASKEQPVIIFDNFRASFQWVDFPFKVKSSAIKILKPQIVIDLQFVFFAMQRIRYQLHNIYMRQWTAIYSEFRISIPPLVIQTKIVEALNRLMALKTELETELTAELAAKKKQYYFYQDSLLSFGSNNKNRKRLNLDRENSSIWQTLGEIGVFVRGNGLQKKDLTDSGIGCIYYSQIDTLYRTFTYQTQSFVSPTLAKKLKKVSYGDLIITMTSRKIEDICKCVVWLGDEEIVVGNQTTIFKHNQNPKYLAYCFQTQQFFIQKRQIAQGTLVIDILMEDLKKIKIPVPPLEEQNRIVAILDKFSSLTTNLLDNLMAEINIHHKQYEYYRDKLLTFLKAETA